MQCLYFKIRLDYKYNLATRPGSRVNQGLTNVTSIACGYKWSIFILSIVRNKIKILDHVVITIVNLVHSDSRDHSYVGQFILCRTRSGDYKRCGDEVLREIMVQMAIDPFVNDRFTTKDTVRKKGCR